MSTKKVYLEMIAFLESHKDSKISDVLKMEEFKDIIVAKKNSNTILKDENGKVFAIFCWYHKQWELLSEVEYGSKASHHSGFNTMCKIGVNKWTKAQSVAKSEKSKLLDLVASGELDPKDISSRLDEIENQRNKVDMKDAPKGSKEEPKLK